jgi:hypothetical protein
MSSLNGQIGELRMVIEVTRKDTGETETVELTSAITDPQAHETLLKEYGDVSNALDGK